MTDVKLLIVDSDRELRRLLWSSLSLSRVFRLVGETNTTSEAMEFIQEHEVDVMFINNQPADPSLTHQGSYLATMIRRERPDIQVVVYSKFKEDAYTACRCMGTGFLLVPFDPLAVHEVMEYLIYIHGLQESMRNSASRSIMIRTRTGYSRVQNNDILFIEYTQRRCKIVTESGETIELSGYTLGDLEKMLEKHGFYRCYQSYLVNLSKVTAVNVDNEAKKYTLQFSGCEEDIPVSRSKYAKLISLLCGKSAAADDQILHLI